MISGAAAGARAAQPSMQVSQTLKLHNPFSSVKPPFVGPDDYHRFSAAGVATAAADEAIVVKTPSPTMDASATSASASAAATSNPDHGWKTVTYPKRHQRRPNGLPSTTDPDRSRANGLPSVFSSVEQKAQERRSALEFAAASAASAAGDLVARSRTAMAGSDDDDDDNAIDAAAHANGEDEPAKKIKQKKPKKIKVTVPEAASKIDAGDLAVFLDEVSTNYETQQDIQLMRFADFFGRAFATVSASQFPWMKMFMESPVAKIIDIPICHISESVYKVSADWIGQKSPEALGDFILWCLDCILDDVASQQVAAKGSRKPVQQIPAKAQVAIFVVLAMTLRRKPDILINLLPKLKDPKYQGQEKLHIIVWVIGQVCQGDLVVGMFSWAHYLVPLVLGKSSINPQSRDLVLQLVERILSVPKARAILLNGAVRKGERLVPPSEFDLLLRAAFPAPSARVKATDRFEAVYPTIKELALAGSPGTKTTKQASQQLLPCAVKAMQENNQYLTKEATDVFIWCLTQNAECYKQWEKLHLENLDASVAVLQRMTDQWKEYSTKLAPLDSLRETVKHLRAKNEESLSAAGDGDQVSSIKDADKYCKVLQGRLNRGSSCMKSGVCVLALAVAIGFFVSPNVESVDWKNLRPMVSSFLSF